MNKEIKVLDKGFVRYIDHMGTDQRIVEAARVSYGSPSKGKEADQKLLEYLFKNKHTSPFEMCKITFNIKMPIFVMRQYVRHRMQNLNEVSARYTQLPEEFYIPKEWRRQDNVNKQGSVVDETFLNYGPTLTNGEGQQGYNASTALLESCSASYGVYKAMLRAGIAKEMARFCLPVNIYTECYSCWDLKNLLHFITLRDDSHAQAEIQEYGKAIKTIVTELFPGVMKAYDKYKFECIER